LDLAIERTRSVLKGWPIMFALFAVVFGCIAYTSRDRLALIPLLCMAVVVAAFGISGWTHLRKLEAATRVLRSVPRQHSEAAASKQLTEQITRVRDHLSTISKPRRVHLKAVPKLVSIVFPVSIVTALYLAIEYFRYEPRVFASPLDVGVPLFIASIWSAIAIQILRNARRDRRLLAEGDSAVATITAQWVDGGRHPRSKINFRFRDMSGRSIHGESDDDSRSLFEEMEIVVFYDPTNPENCVPLDLASCELRGF
jgi:hypothetical protein